MATDSLAAADDCMICFERPETYGLLENCDHQFCYECIKHWRASSNLSYESSNERSSRTLQELFMEGLEEQSLRDRGADQRLMGLDFDDDAYRDGYRAAMAALEYGTFELGPDAPVNRARAEQLRRQDELTSMNGWGPDQDSNEEYSRARNTKACPLCRQPSKHVYLSANFPTNAHQKDMIIKSAKAQKKRTLCRDFEASLNNVEGFYCPRFNECLYAHLKPVEDPNSQVRQEPFVFSEARIAQLKHRRVAAIDRQALLSALGSATDFPAGLTFQIEEMLADATDGLEPWEVHTVSQELIAEFFQFYEAHSQIQREYDVEHYSNYITTYGSGTDNAGRSRVWHVTGHHYHSYDVDGRLVEIISDDSLDRRTLARNGLKEWTESISEYQPGLKVIVHHFVAPVSASFEPPAEYDTFARTTREQNSVEQQRAFESADQETSERHRYHVWSEDGEYMNFTDQNDGPISETHPTFVEFAPILTQRHHSAGIVQHHFLSSLSVEDARTVIMNQPDYRALLSTIAVHEHGPTFDSHTAGSNVEPLAALLRAHGLLIPPGAGSHFTSYGGNPFNLMDQMTDYDSEDERDEHDWESDEDEDEDEDEDDSEGLPMPHLVRITTSSTGDAHENETHTFHTHHNMFPFGFGSSDLETSDSESTDDDDTDDDDDDDGDSYDEHTDEEDSDDGSDLEVDARVDGDSDSESESGSESDSSSWSEAEANAAATINGTAQTHSTSCATSGGNTKSSKSILDTDSDLSTDLYTMSHSRDLVNEENGISNSSTGSLWQSISEGETNASAGLVLSEPGVAAEEADTDLAVE